jgi:hypothetical protein
MKKNNFFLLVTIISSLSFLTDIKAGNVFQDSCEALHCAISYIGIRTANSLHATREYLDGKLQNIKCAFCRLGQKCKDICSHKHEAQVIIVKK